ncbi:MAG: ABC transporter permease [Planctomycetaceae bacterium]
MDFDIRPYDFVSALRGWLLLLAGLTVISLAIAFVLAMARNGASGLKIFTAGLMSWLSDTFSVSLRRVYAVARLTLLEAVRRKALLVFVVFAVLLMFAGWFIADSNERPELQVQVHVTFLLKSIAWLLLPAVIFLSCWAIPEDIRLRSMHTVVTKPVRRLEIVLGRISGLAIVFVFVLVVMGIIGQLWLSRRIPENAQAALQCRVPMFGNLYFISSEGQPSETGVNVGDVYAFRSHIQGNSRARGVFLFPGLTEEALTTSAEGIQELQLECRFEAFRTVKGTEKSVREGIQAQYTLMSNPREEAFGILAQSETLRPVAEAFRNAEFRNAADLLKGIAQRIRTSPQELRPADYVAFHNGLFNAGDQLRRRQDDRLKDVSEQLLAAAVICRSIPELMARQDAGARVEIPWNELAAAVDAVSTTVQQRSADLLEALPRLEVPLPAFSVAEYHGGDNATINLTRIPRTLRFVAGDETLARFLADITAEWNASGKLLDNGTLKATLADELVEQAKISRLNAERVVVVLGEELAAGKLKIDAGKLAPPENVSWFVYYRDLISLQRLVSEDSEGWQIEKDLVKDLGRDGYLRVEVACVDDQMYLGMARPDLFIRKADRPFWIGYWKALVGMGSMLLLMVVVGVSVSCVVKSNVALFFSMAFLVVGQFHNFVDAKLSELVKGMGSVESAVLLAQHRNPEVGMDVSSTTMKVVQTADKSLDIVLWVFSRIVPDFGVFSKPTTFVENRFDVPVVDVVLPSLAVFFGFFVPCVLMAGALLKFRELESK